MVSTCCPLVGSDQRLSWFLFGLASEKRPCHLSHAHGRFFSSPFHQVFADRLLLNVTLSVGLLAPVMFPPSQAHFAARLTLSLLSQTIHFSTLSRFVTEQCSTAIPFSLRACLLLTISDGPCWPSQCLCYSLATFTGPTATVRRRTSLFCAANDASPAIRPIFRLGTGSLPTLCSVSRLCTFDLTHTSLSSMVDLVSIARSPQTRRKVNTATRLHRVRIHRSSATATAATWSCRGPWWEAILLRPPSSLLLGIIRITALLWWTALVVGMGKPSSSAGHCCWACGEGVSPSPLLLGLVGKARAHWRTLRRLLDHLWRSGIPSWS